MQFIQMFDNKILEFIRINLHTPMMDKIVPIVTSLGNMGLIWIVIGLAFIANKKYRKYGFIMLCTLCIGALIGDGIIKPIVARARPFNFVENIQLLIKAPTSYSFPSGHTMSSFAAATIIYIANKKMGIGAFLLAALIGFSRMYLYVHYPSDVLVGCVLGITLSTCVYKIISPKYDKKFNK
ncbi:phosphatase PAP2 family protein [Clostridium botulinum]|uniref:phosphatase PAP2 family protein n=1 Tax=Clostridium botulinum TaxID=1491 RepID=UPI0007732670|nr:phosphatase PAP2 family protein [Clostridium botulinum]NFL87163.1 phosphatase PAP2 family protein [Clostridium botulinum]NFO22361.1 phosphatase PAP2 family protein [Clostridium botulinum]